jgi:hypothetical protein
MLFATTDAARYSRFLQTPFDFRKNLLDHLFTVAARGFHHFFDYAITVGIQRLKTQLFEFGFNVVDTIALYNPVAIDLRFVLAMFKINSD